jgi:hypothetical protein
MQQWLANNRLGVTAQEQQDEDEMVSGASSLNELETSLQ